MSKVVDVFMAQNGELYPLGLCGYVPPQVDSRGPGNPNANMFSGRRDKNTIVRTKGRIVRKKWRNK